MKYSNLIIILLLFAACKKGKIVETKPIRQDITETVFAPGILEPDDKYNLTAQTDGYLTKVTFKEGDLLKTNQIVAVIDNKSNLINSESAGKQVKIAEINTTTDAPALRQIEANIQLAREKVQQDELLFGRYQRLFEANSVPLVELENRRLTVVTSRANLTALKAQADALKQQAEQQLISQKNTAKVNAVNSENNTIKAIVGGKVYKKLKQTGDFVRRGDVIAIVGNANATFAKLNIDEASIAKVKLGQKAVIQLNTQKDKKYMGEVYEILPSFDDASQSFICKVRFTETLDFSIAGTQLETNIIIGEKKNVLLIPRSLLGYGNKVKLAGSDTLKTIKTGIISTQWVEITEGLSENDALVALKPQ